MSGRRTRREPPPFRRVDVARVEARNPRMTRVTLTGPELEGLDIGLPAASARLLIPPSGGDVVIPTWNGNEFLHDDGTRPAIRTVTPLEFDPGELELVVELVRHGDGPLARFADTARPGDRTAVSGTGRGYEVDQSAPSYLLAGDETALPAISVLLPELPSGAEVQAIVEIADAEGRLDLPVHPRASVRWCVLPAGAPPGEALVAAVTEADLDPEVRVWAAGEAAAVQRIRRHLFDDRGLSRSRTAVRGYWKHGRQEGPAPD